MRICLVSEGTYPYAMGGVSTWCDQLIRGLPHHEWEVFPLVVDGNEVPIWELPSPSVKLTPLALWTPPPPRGRKPSKGELAAYGQLVSLLVTPLARIEDNAPDGHAMLAALQEFRAACLPHLDAPEGPSWLADEQALRVLARRWQAQHGTALSLADGIDWSQMLGHLLRPLFMAAVQADVVHASMNGPSILVGLTALWDRGTPMVMSEHGIYLRERYLLTEAGPLSDPVRFLRLNFFRLLACAGYAAAAALAPHSRYNTRWQLRGGVDWERIHVMYNGVLIEDFEVATSEPDVPTISFLGRLDPIKDIKTLLRAFALVHQELPEARLRIFGAAPDGHQQYVQECHALVQTLGVAQAVVFEGPTRHPMDAYHAGTIVALSSISEGFPFTVVEAMACGRPVVATHVGGVSEAVDATGFVVPPSDPAAFASACLALLRDPEDRARRAVAARERVLEWFTVGRWLSAYDDLYTHVTSHAPREERGDHADRDERDSGHERDRDHQRHNADERDCVLTGKGSS